MARDIRGKVARRVSEALGRVSSGSDAHEELYQLMLSTLSPQQWSAYTFVRDSPVRVSALGLSRVLKISPVATASLLRRLYRFGLLCRCEETRGQSTYFIYWPNPDSLPKGTKRAANIRPRPEP